MTASARPQGPFEPLVAGQPPIDPEIRIGHVHLRTADIDRIRAFYVDLMGFDVVFEARDVPGWGTTGDILFVSAGGYHHHLGFNTWKSAGGAPQPDGVTGLHHVGLHFSTRARLATTVQRLIDGGVKIRAALDHGTHEAVYLQIPTATRSSSPGIAPSTGGCPTAIRPRPPSTPRSTWRTCSPKRAEHRLIDHEVSG